MILLQNLEKHKLQLKDCVNSQITFTDQSIDGIEVDNSGNCDYTSKRKWEI